MRQTKTKSERSVKRCSLCGIKTWQWDEQRCIWTGPWHTQDCPEVPGGEDLQAANVADRMRWAEEQYVPRDKGRLILKAIGKMLDKRNTPEQHEQYKAAILAELRKVKA